MATPPDATVVPEAATLEFAAACASATAVPPAAWWHRAPLGVGAAGLELAGVSVASLAAQYGTPLYAYSGAAIISQIQRLQAALATTALPHAVWYAMKANRFRPVLQTLRNLPGVGLDACSPREVALGLELGFSADEISLTAGMLSDRDLAWLFESGVHCTLDTRSALRRYARLCSELPTSQRKGRRTVGLRIDPAVAVGWGGEAKLAYGNAKFGFDAAAVPDVVREARALGLEVDLLHLHCGWGMQRQDLPRLGEAFARLAELARLLPDVHTLDVGGGLCERQRAEDDPLPLGAWAELLRQHLAPPGRRIACEPGTFAVAGAGILVVEVNTVETRRGVTWVGVDAGFNVNLYPAHYGIPLEPLHVGRPLDPDLVEVTIAGNINEAADVFAHAAQLPRVREGDLLAFWPAGAYGSSMASDHCLRGWAREAMI